MAENSSKNRAMHFWNRYFRISLNIVILVTIISGYLLIREYVKGDYTEYSNVRIGALCEDGWQSSSTGRGTCSHHGGVDHWLYEVKGYHTMDPQPYWIITISALSYILLIIITNKVIKKITERNEINRKNINEKKL